MKIMRRESANCAGSAGRRSGESPSEDEQKLLYPLNPTRRDAMWTKPEFTEMRFGFEVTMYIYNR
jgi:coenzyme PQQ precursor peptide PqqA